MTNNFYTIIKLDSSPAEPKGKPRNTGVCILSLFQGIFLTQESNRVSCIEGGFFTNWAIREASMINNFYAILMEMPVVSFVSELMPFCIKE